MKLFTKILLMLLFASAIFVGGYALMEVQRLESDFVRDSEERNSTLLSSIMPGLSAALWNLDRELVKTSLTSLFANGDVSAVTLFDDNGEQYMKFRIAHAGEPPQEINTFKSEKGLTESEALPFDTQPSKMLSPITNMEKQEHKISGFLWMPDKVKNSVKYVGSVQMRFSTNAIYERVQKLKARIIYFSALMILGILVLTYWFLSRSVLQYLYSLKRASDDIAKGKFTKVKEKQSRDEIGVLTAHFNLMVSRLEDHLRHLKILAEEEIRICSAVDFLGLSEQIDKSFKKITNNKTGAYIYYFDSLLNPTSTKKGFISLEQKEFGSESAGNEIAPHKNSDDIIEVKNPTSSEILALISILSLELVPEEMSSLKAVSIAIANAIANIRFIEEQKQQQKMLFEIETTRFVQQTLVPQKEQCYIGNLEIVSCFQPADQCGGDWWNYYPLKDGRVLLLIGDVTGHGISSAFITAIVKGYCDGVYAREAATVRPEVLLRELNILLSTVSSGRLLMTMFAIIIDTANETVTFSNAGHCFPFVFPQDGVPIRLCQTGPRLGFHASCSLNNPTKIDKRIRRGFVAGSSAFKAGNIMFVFSDGLVEAENHQEEQYSEKRLSAILQSKVLEKSDLVAIRKAVSEDLNQFIQDKAMLDDVTFFIVKFLDSRNEPQNIPALSSFFSGTLTESSELPKSFIS